MANPRSGDVPEHLPQWCEQYAGHPAQDILAPALAEEVALHWLVQACRKRMQLDPRGTEADTHEDLESGLVYRFLKQKYLPQGVYNPDNQSLRFPGTLVQVGLEHITDGRADLDGHAWYKFYSTITVITQRDLQRSRTGKAYRAPEYPRPSLSLVLGDKAIWSFADLEEDQIKELLDDPETAAAKRRDLNILLESFRERVPLPGQRPAGK